MLINNLTKEDLGKFRFNKKFLFFPKTLNGKTKWLRFVSIIEQVRFVKHKNNNYVIEWVEIDF